MNRTTLTFLALAASMIYGVLFATSVDETYSWYAPVGAVVVALCWIAVAMLSRGEAHERTR